MKPSKFLLLAASMFCTYISFYKTDPVINLDIDELNRSGYAFTANTTKINSKYSEIPSTVFRNKLVIVSSKKIGAIGSGIDANTKQPYSNLFCTDAIGKNQYTSPILFSRILNTKGSEGQVSFSPDEHTIYYTRSERKNSSNYKLYKAELVKDSYGNWINHMLVSINGDDFSIENPHVSADGKYLYFSSNMNGGFGGFDLYKAAIQKDGNLDKPINLGDVVNTELDEKYPFASKNNKELFFSSKGHTNQGGYDIFISNRQKDNSFSKPRNLGRRINSRKDDIAFTLVDDKNGVFSSDEASRSKRFNMYKFNSKAIYQNLEGIIINEDNEILPNTIVVLYDDNGKELQHQLTSKNAAYKFKIRPFENYSIKAFKDGFEEVVLAFKSNEPESYIAYKEDLKMTSDIAKK
jgi:hypothetical protein